MTKFFLILLVAVIAISQAYGQESNALYYQAFVQYVKHLNNNQSPVETLYVEEAGLITEGFPSRIENRTLKLITDKNKREIYQANNNKITHITIYPIQIQEGAIVINITPFRGTYKGTQKAYTLAISDWVNVYFTYDCNQKAFKFYKLEEAGI